MAETDFLIINATIVGYRDVLRALGRYDKSARQRVVSGLRSALKPVITDARERVPSPTPMTGWRLFPARNPQSRSGQGWPAWNTNELRAGIKVTFKPSKARGAYRSRTVVAIRSTTAIGAIYEFARRSDKHRTFISNLGATTGGRLVWRAFDKHRPEVDRAVRDAISTANANLQSAVLSAADRGA